MKKNDTESWSRYVISGALIILFVAWAVSPYFMKWWSGSSNWNKTADFGNTFGAINSLFAGLAFLYLVIAIWLQKNELGLQRKELSLQRKELELTRSVLDEQRQQLQDQAESLRKQTFESTFLQLLKLPREAVEIATYTDRKFADPKDFLMREKPKLLEVHEYSGTQAFDKIRNKLQTWVQQRTPFERKSYDAFMHDYTIFFDYYLKTILEIVQFVDISHINQKNIYFRLIRALLFAPGYLEIVFYHSIFGSNVSEIKTLIEKYGFFLHIPEWIPEEHRILYEPGAFEDRLSYENKVDDDK
jgi:hypothetical protein